MLKVYQQDSTTHAQPDERVGLPSGAVWVDLLNPTQQEEELVEREFSLSVPTREDMVEIEPSSRLYREDQALHLTASIMCGVSEGDPKTVPIAFVLTRDHLVTVRYDSPKPFDAFSAHLKRQPDLCASAGSTLVFLLDAIVERIADILEEVAPKTDAISRAVFHRERGPERRRITNEQLEEILSQIGSAQEILSKVRESLSSLSRLISFLAFSLPEYAPDEASHVKSVARDVSSLRDQSASMSANVTFLLDAALGLINIEQNAIIKIFSVAAVIFLPPTLVGTVYGMNFDYMPELHWRLGYPFAVALMIISAILPYLWFKRKGWL